MDRPPDSPETATGTPSPARGVLVARGARAAEAVLLERLDRELAATDAAALERPVRVVVPSASLRLHLSATVVRRRGAALGLQVQTLFAVALEILERCGEASPWRRLPGDLLYDVLVRRRAAGEPLLADALGPLVDGFGAVAATVRDLLDAGLEPVHAEFADEALVAAGDDGTATTAAEIERGRALVRVARRVAEDLEARGVLRRTALYARAAELVAADPLRALPTRRLFVHGFADATGVAGDLLESLLRAADGRLVLDTPPAVAGGAPGAAAAWEEAFARRLRERLGGAVGEAVVEPADGAPPAAAIARFQAPGGEAEARAVALRVRALLDDGVPAERIGVVARRLEPHRLALRHHLEALAVPFSAVGARGSTTPAGRRIRALLDLLRRRGELAADRWLDAPAALTWDPGDGRRTVGGPFVDLRLAFAALSAGRLQEVAGLDLDALLGDRDGLPLPVRQGLSYADAEPAAGGGAAGDGPGARTADEEEGEGDEGDGGADGAAAGRTAGRPPSAARRRWVRRALLAAAVDAARALLAELDEWPQPAAAGAHVARLRRLLTRHLRWRPEGGELARLFDLLDAVAADLPADLGLDFDELRLLLGRLLQTAGGGALGGAGGGVQVLSVTEARGRTFEHLFVVGVHRGAFPRIVEADPLLPDELRGAVAAVLPDLARKRAGHEEERYLFAQLLSAAPRVTVSWWSRDDDGQPLSPSPLVARLPGFGPHEPPAEAETAPPVFSAAAAGGDERPAAEAAVVAGLAGMPRDGWQTLLAAAVDEAHRRLPPPRSSLEGRDVAAARRAVLDEFDPPDAERAHRLGPYFGFLGAVRAAGGGAPLHGDPRAGEGSLWLSRAENLAACPWQLFLRKLLRLEPTPDPLAALPGLDALVLGNAVHGALEAIVAHAGAPAGVELAALAEAAPVPVPWPDDAELDALLADASRRALADAGMPLPGLARALAARARPYVERARTLDWPADGGPLPVVGAEVEGEVVALDAAGEPRRLRFRADRVDRGGGGDGALRLTDYKTGRPLSERTKPETRAQHHLRGLYAGQRLQATAYRLAAGAADAGTLSAGAEAVGRYLFLKPDLPSDEMAEASAAGDAFPVGFDAVATGLLAAWDAGAFFPRLVDPHGEKEPARCGFCEVSEACLRLDSSARRRLVRWNHERAGPADGAAERAHAALWWLALGRPPGEGSEQGGESGGKSGGDSAGEGGGGGDG